MEAAFESFNRLNPDWEMRKEDDSTSKDEDSASDDELEYQSLDEALDAMRNNKNINLQLLQYITRRLHPLDDVASSPAMLSPSSFRRAANDAQLKSPSFLVPAQTPSVQTPVEFSPRSGDPPILLASAHKVNSLQEFSTEVIPAYEAGRSSSFGSSIVDVGQVHRLNNFSSILGSGATLERKTSTKRKPTSKLSGEFVEEVVRKEEPNNATVLEEELALALQKITELTTELAALKINFNSVLLMPISNPNPNPNPNNPNPLCVPRCFNLKYIRFFLYIYFFMIKVHVYAYEFLPYMRTQKPRLDFFFFFS